MSDSKTIITDVQTFIMNVPQPTPVESAIGRHEGIWLIGVRLRTADGIEGIGWTNLIGGRGADSVRAFIEQVYVPIISGRDAFDVRGLWTEMFMRSMTRGRKGVALYALSAVDIALWDIVTQSVGLPLHRYLGAVREEVAVYGDGLWPSLPVEKLVAEAQNYRDMGLVGAKVKIGLDTSRAGIRADMARVDAVREVIGEDMLLLIDANQAYDPLTAEFVAERLAERDAYWLEEPLLADSISDYGRFAERSAVPVATGENEYSRYGFRDLIEARGVHILQPDVHRVGGITEFMRIVALADTHNLPIAPHTSHELHAQLLSAATTALMVEYYPWLPEDFYSESFDVTGGTIAMSQTPGIGVRITEEAFARYSVS